MTQAVTAFLTAVSIGDTRSALAIAREVGTEDMLIALGCYFHGAVAAVEEREGAPPGTFLARLGLAAYP